MVNWRQVETRYRSLSTRERGLILGSGVLGVLLLGFVFWVEPLWNAQSDLRREVIQKNSEFSRLTGQVEQVTADLKLDPNQALRMRIGELEKRIEALDDELLSQTTNLVPADQMGNLLQELLGQSDRVKFISMTSLGAEPYQLRDAFSDSLEDDSGLYRQGIRLVVQGRYGDIYDYLLALEQQPWQFYWQGLDYEVKQYPLAEVTLDIFTFSTSEAFIGL